MRTILIIALVTFMGIDSNYFHSFLIP